MSDTQEWCMRLAGRLSGVLLPHNVEMPVPKIVEVVEQHIADYGGLGLVLTEAEEQLRESRARVAELEAENERLRDLIGSEIVPKR